MKKQKNRLNYSTTNHPLLHRIKQNPQSAADVFDAAFRMDGKTYVPIPKPIK
ncbi:hypothetical protein [Flavobacterium sp. J27]|uniref:hypothetical protein n=1 Tax=Flavobacterium sp. J27 TaxID=2060419 RepID=UPI0013EE6185|nr:hypothetical protein [Flavobacterium sp. J27]